MYLGLVTVDFEYDGECRVVLEFDSEYDGGAVSYLKAIPSTTAVPCRTWSRSRVRRQFRVVLEAAYFIKSPCGQVL